MFRLFVALKLQVKYFHLRHDIHDWAMTWYQSAQHRQLLGLHPFKINRFKQDKIDPLHVADMHHLNHVK